MVSLVDAAVTLLRAGMPEDVKVYRGRVTDPTTPARFVIVTDLDGTRTAESFTGRADTRSGGVRLTVAAVLPEGSTGSPDARAEWLVDRCEHILVGSKAADASAFRHEMTRYMGVDEGLASRVNAYYVADFSSSRHL